MALKNQILNVVSQREDQNSLYIELKDYIPKTVLNHKNALKGWRYGYNEQYDMVIISKSGQIGQIMKISGLIVALPLAPEKVYSRSKKIAEQYWERQEYPKELQRIQSIFQWNELPSEFKDRWIDHIESHYDSREQGFWFMNYGEPTYVTGSHWMYLQWSSIDVGYPDYREANRIFFIFWEACKADIRCFGMIYLKIRRSGFSFMCSSEVVNIGTLARDSRVGILSKTGIDAKKNQRPQIRFTNGYLRVASNKTSLVKFLTSSNMFDKKKQRMESVLPVYTLINFEEQERQAVDKAETRMKAMKLAMDAPIENMIPHSQFLGIRFKNEYNVERTDKAIRVDYLNFADKNPDAFIKTYNNPLVKVQYLVNKGINLGLIDITTTKGQAIWGDSKKFIAQIPDKAEPLKFLSELCLTEKGKDFYSQLKSMAD